MKRSKHIKDTYTVMQKKLYLEGVRNRLISDVGAYFNMIDNEHDKGNRIGFWGSVRLIFPIIEAVAKTIYRKRINDDIRVPKLLKELNISYPNIVWNMYRNSLTHSDNLIHISKGKNKTIHWSLTTSAGNTSAGHFFTNNQVHIDTRSLYEDLLVFLDDQISNATTTVYVKSGIHVGRKYQGELNAEIKRFPSI